MWVRVPPPALSKVNQNNVAELCDGKAAKLMQINTHIPIQPEFQWVLPPLPEDYEPFNPDEVNALLGISPEMDRLMREVDFLEEMDRRRQIWS